MYNPEYIAYMNEQIKKAVNKERKEFLEDLDKFREEGYIPLAFKPLNKLIKKWEKRFTS